ncbi:MAG: beta-galactosidase [Planctomycetota bacterium]|jgi:hypothetical protein
MPNVTFDDRSFLVDDRRIWLVSGSIHYFRIPEPLWRDRLLKAKRAGLNCVSTYVAWNIHEPSEGERNFEGNHDVVRFVQLAQELGLYVILRPGPYIGAEWDFGGLPAWLAAKTGIAYRTANATYTHYFDKYFRQVLGRLADRQVSRGGNIVLIQNENAYRYTMMPDRLNYLEFINQLFRRAGFDVPIINCNRFSDPPVPDNVECVNASEDAVQQLKRMSLRQPAAPLLVTEFSSGWPDSWSGEHQGKGAREVARRALEILGCGAQYNYYMFHGGTNFGFWGARLSQSEAVYQATSYDYDAPVAEGGGLAEKYYLTRLVNLLAAHMGRFWATSFMEEPPVTVHDSTNVLNLTGTAGRWAVVTSNGRDDITSARLSLPGGKELTVSLEPLGATAVPVNLAIAEGQTLDYSNLMPLGLFGQNIAIFHGPAGWPGRLSLNGSQIQADVPEDDEPELIEHSGLLVVLVNSDLAMRTWPMDEVIVFGPDYVADTVEDVTPRPGSKQYAILGLDGKLTHKKLKTPAPKRKKVTAPRLGSWRRVSVCREPVGKGLEWQGIPGPRDVDRLGVHYGYVWYRLEIPSQRAKRRRLFLPGCADRALVYLNRRLLGTWGWGPGAKRTPISASFKRGTNILTLLVDNLGRLCSGAGLGEPKGLFGHVYDAKPLRVKFKLKQQETFSKRIVPRQLSHMVRRLEATPVWAAEVQIPLTKVTPIHLSFADVPNTVAVLCNDHSAGFFPSEGLNWGDVTLGADLKKGKNVIKLLLWGDVSPHVLDNFALHLLLEPLSQDAAWSYRAWELPEEGGYVVGKDQPAWYVANFKYTPPDQPLFVHIIGAKKGQLFLNRHDVGRFWTVGPQQYYYLPECWLAENNELLVFEEGGSIPAGSRLEFRPLGPYQD